jgi:hypothetical protein
MEHHSKRGMIPLGKDGEENPQENLSPQHVLMNTTDSEKTVEEPVATQETVPSRRPYRVGAQPEPPTQPVDDEADNYWNFLATGM